MAKRLEDTNQALLNASDKVASLQEEGKRIQTEILDADQAFQAEMSGLQAQLTSEDAQIRQQLEPLYAQLQSAYEQIAARQASTAQAGGDESNQPSRPAYQDDDHGDNDDHGDHEDNDDDEDHGGDDHDGEHDND